MAVTEHPAEILGFPRTWWDRFEPPPGYVAEIIMGELVVSPTPVTAHVRLQMYLARMLQPTVPSGYEAIYGLEWVLPEPGLVAQAPQPDLVVVPNQGPAFNSPPLLAIEILSRSDFRILPEHPDYTRISGKRHDYALNGLEHYLEIDLTAPELVIKRFELQNGPDPVELVGIDSFLYRKVPFQFAIDLHLFDR